MNGMQLLDLVYTIYSRAWDIYRRSVRGWTAMPGGTNEPVACASEVGGGSNGNSWSGSNGSKEALIERVWHECWLPSLQCMARQCTCDRRATRLQALTHLQRALLLTALADGLTPPLWADCFERCLLPLIAAFAAPPTHTQHTHDPAAFEEMRIRITALISKVSFSPFSFSSLLYN